MTIRSQSCYQPYIRMRQRLQRWKLPGFPRRHARQALQNLAELRDLAPPRVSAAVLSTMWNRWVTARRFQRSAACVLGCSPTARDSIEHYACCPFVREAASAYLHLRLRGPPEAVSDFLLVSTPPGQRQPQSVITRMALLVYATYVVTNNARHGEMSRGRTEMIGMLQQGILQAAEGHCGAEAALRSITMSERAVRRRVA